MARPSLYLAGPDVFCADARQVGERKRAVCERYGFEGLFPGDGESADPGEIFDRNCALMARADAGVFNLTPFRGPSADAGTVFELGFLFARGKPVHGYSAVAAPYAERVAASHGPARDGVDRDGFWIEDFREADNLMLTRAIARSGGTLTVVAEDTLAAFRAFEQCLAALRG